MTYAIAEDWFELLESKTLSAIPRAKRATIIKDPTPVAATKIPIYGVTHKIRLLSGWGADWDGTGAIPISPAAIERATALVDDLYETSVVLGIPWQNPNVTASAHSEVVLEWWNRSKKLTIYVGEIQSEYVKVWGPDIDNEMEDGVLSGDAGVLLLRWMGE